jgi:ATP-dependent Clp protease protease subunit
MRSARYRSSSLPNIGNVDSIATIVFLAGAERLAVPHSTFMFHGVAFDLTGNIRADQTFLTDKLQSVKADHKKMASIIKERANFERIENIMTLFSTQATKDADYALAHGIIHKIEHLQIPEGSRTLVFTE